MVETDPGVHAIVYRLTKEPLLSRPPRDTNKAILYVSHESADEELRREPLIRDLIDGEPEAAFHACDLRGVGDSEPQTTSLSDRGEYSTDYFYSSHALMLDYPYVGQRTFDVLRVLDWLNEWGYGHIHLAAKGYGALPSTFAALLSPRVVQVTLKNALTSYTEVAESRDYRWPLSSLLAGVLTSFDLPDCYRELKKKNLTLLDPWGATRSG
jgi:pimeloyl-ACP methyl ester carboxylesterase